MFLVPESGAARRQPRLETGCEVPLRASALNPLSVGADDATPRYRRLMSVRFASEIRVEHHGRIMPFVPISAKNAEGRKAFLFPSRHEHHVPRRIDMKEKLQGILQSAKEQLAAAA